MVFSTTATETLAGLEIAKDDLASYDLETGTASLFFSGDLFLSNENIDAAHILEDGRIILSTAGAASLGGLTFGDGDLVEYDPGTGTASLFFSEGSFSGNEDIDAVHVLANGKILLSTAGSATLGGLSFQDGDIVEYDPDSQTATLFLSESVFSNNEDIDAIHLLSDGRLLLSTANAASLGELTFRDGDVVEYDALLGTATLVFSEDLFTSGAQISALSALPAPEPGTLILLAGGGVSVLIRYRRRAAG